jgi:hypothetical protein
VRVCVSKRRHIELKQIYFPISLHFSSFRAIFFVLALPRHSKDINIIKEIKKCAKLQFMFMRWHHGWLLYCLISITYEKKVLTGNTWNKKNSTAVSKSLWAIIFHKKNVGIFLSLCVVSHSTPRHPYSHFISSFYSGYNFQSVLMEKMPAH